MPYLNIQTNIALDKLTQNSLLEKASERVAELLNKSENYVMVTVKDSIAMQFSGTRDACAFVELKSIGLPEQSCKDFSNALCSLISDVAAVDKSRVYIEFTNAERHLWGWNGTTF